MTSVDPYSGMKYLPRGTLILDEPVGIRECGRDQGLQQRLREQTPTTMAYLCDLWLFLVKAQDNRQGPWLSVFRYFQMNAGHLASKSRSSSTTISTTPSHTSAIDAS